jgi:oligopeptide transport system substrate-binding protein
MKTKTIKSCVALLMAFLMTAAVLSGCSRKKYDENGNEIIDKGAEINMYIADFPYDLDPGRIQFDADLGKYYSLIYEGLFKIGENGKLEAGLAKEWEYEEDERDGKLKLQITLASTSWSDGVSLDSDDVVYSFKRILSPGNSNPAAALLYPIENAKDAKSGLVTIDDVGFSAINSNTIEIVFEEEFTDVEYFLRTLANPVFTPLREDIITNYGEDWAQPMYLKEPRDGAENVFNTIVTNGPFTVKEWTRDSILLERSTYYKNLGTNDKYTKYVTPYRIMINFSNDADTQLANFELDEEMERVFLIGSFSKDGYAANEKDLRSFANASAYTYYFNTQNKVLSDERVRKALSIALDRNEIASIVGRGVVPATGYVPTGVECDSKGKKDYREETGDVISASANLDEAKNLLKEAGVNSGKLTITIRGDLDWEAEVADYAAEVWKGLGFNVSISKVNAYSSAKSEISAYEEKLATGDFDIIGLDYCALSTDAYSFLVPYAREYSGSVVLVDDDAEPSTPHVTGFDDQEYNELINGTIERDEEGEIVSATGILGAEDAEARYEIYKQAEAMLAEKVPSAPLFFGTNSYLVSNKLSGVKYNFYGAPILTKTSLKGYEKYKMSELTDEAESTENNSTDLSDEGDSTDSGN